MSLTNNWNPQPSDSIVNSPNNLVARWATKVTAQRNHLSNQYGPFSLCGNAILLTPNKVGWTFMYESLRPSRITASSSSMKPSLTLSKITRPKSYPAMSTSPIFFHGMGQRNSPPYPLTCIFREIANDPRCNSTLPNSPTCATTTVTNWHAIMADHIKSVDPNHLVTSG